MQRRTPITVLKMWTHLKKLTKGAKTPRLCFLLGLPRSGTTLLAHLLQQHPDLLAPPEPWLMLALEAFGKVDRNHPADAGLVGMATNEFLRRIKQTEVFRAFSDAAYGQYLSDAGKKCFIDKTPRYWMALDFIDALYPEAPQILLFRNPYAVAASEKRTWNIPILLEECGPFHAPYLADRILGLRKLASCRSHPQVQVVFYEDLVTRSDAVVRQLIAGLGFDPKLLPAVTVNQTDYLLEGSFGDRKILERSGIDDSSVNAWQRELTLAEKQAVTDMVGADLFVELGYERELEDAQKAGVVIKEPAVGEWYREILENWWRLLEGAQVQDLALQSEQNEEPERASSIEHAQRLVDVGAATKGYRYDL